MTKITGTDVFKFARQWREDERYGPMECVAYLTMSNDDEAVRFQPFGCAVEDHASLTDMRRALRNYRDAYFTLADKAHNLTDDVWCVSVDKLYRMAFADDALVEDLRGNVAQILANCGVDEVQAGYDSGGGCVGLLIEESTLPTISMFGTLNGDGGAWASYDLNTKDEHTYIAGVDLQARPPFVKLDGRDECEPHDDALTHAKVVIDFLRLFGFKSVTEPEDALTSMVIAEYERIVLANRETSGEHAWDTVKGVALDTTGEAFYEVVDLAHDFLGTNVELQDPVWERLHLAFGEMQSRFVEILRTEGIVAPCEHGTEHGVFCMLCEATKQAGIVPTVEDGEGTTDYYTGDVTRFGTPILTAGRLRELLTNVPDDFHVLVATDGWWTNIECVGIGTTGEAGTGVVNIFPTVKASEAGDFDGRQF